jgi:ArsR family transcriptional regulator, lead/cadmium/zinc/bismuth-responsive transcriptional repressor
MIMDSTTLTPQTADPHSSTASEASDAPAPVLAGTAEVCDEPFVQADILASVRPRLVAPRDAAALAATFAVLGDPTRVRLLDALAQRELCVCELSELVSSTESAVSHQLRLLRSLRLVRSRRAGRMVYYALDDDHIRALLTQGRRHIEEEKR